MAPTVVLECTQCGGLLLAAKSQKTRCCPYCNAKVDLKKAKRLASAESAMEASEILCKLKAQRQNNTRKPKLT
jgi:hypothetical protein